jgi:hypothetical protein
VLGGLVQPKASDYTEITEVQRELTIPTIADPAEGSIDSAYTTPDSSDWTGGEFTRWTMTNHLHSAYGMKAKWSINRQNTRETKVEVAVKKGGSWEIGGFAKEAKEANFAYEKPDVHDDYHRVMYTKMAYRQYRYHSWAWGYIYQWKPYVWTGATTVSNAIGQGTWPSNTDYRLRVLPGDHYARTDNQSTQFSAGVEIEGLSLDSIAGEVVP